MQKGKKKKRKGKARKRTRLQTEMKKKHKFFLPPPQNILEVKNKMTGRVLVKDVMSKNVKVVPPDYSVKEVVAAMNKFNIGSIVVVQGDRPVGVISERDILRRVVEPCLTPETLTARQVMTTPVLTISETASIDEAAKLMATKKIRKLPVMKKEKLVGIVTFTDIVNNALNMLSMLEELVKPYHRSF